MKCSRVSCLASTSTGELRLLKNYGIAKFGGQKSALCRYNLCFSARLGLSKFISRGWAKEMGKGGWSGKQPSPPEWECVAGEVLQLEELAEVQTQNGEQGARTLPHLCQAAPSPAPARCGRMGNAATERCTRPGNEQQEQHRVGMRGEFTRGQSPSPFIFGRFG